MEMSHIYYYILLSIRCFDCTLCLVCFPCTYMVLKTRVCVSKPAFVSFFVFFVVVVHVLQKCVEGLCCKRVSGKVHRNANYSTFAMHCKMCAFPVGSIHSTTNSLTTHIVKTSQIT